MKRVPGGGLCGGCLAFSLSVVHFQTSDLIKQFTEKIRSNNELLKLFVI